VGPIGNRIIRRLDRVYSFDMSNMQKFSMRSCILPGFILSDHTPVLAELKGAPADQRSTMYRMNNSHIKDKALQKKIDAMWVHKILEGEITKKKKVFVLV
jgi:hypothetical protein